MSKGKNEIPPFKSLYLEIKQLIETARNTVAQIVNSELTMLYWNIGRLVSKEVLHDKRAEYGKQVIITLSMQLTMEYGSGWGEKLLRHCTRFAEVFPEESIVYTLCRQFSWSHRFDPVYRKK
jgi:hypothetical protein